MDIFPRLRSLGCAVCGDPVSPCPSPACPPELFRDVAPVVYRSVLISPSYPQFTRQELESKLRTGEIDRFLPYPLKDPPKSCEDRHSYGHRKPFPSLAAKGSMTVPPRPYHRTSPGFFSDLGHLQRQLVSGPSRWRQPTGRQDKQYSSMALAGANPEIAQTTKVSDAATRGLFPPILDVWAQHDAMQRSITLRI